jgi:hypothetical protein
VNIGMRLTMDSLIRTLRGFVHDLADELEYGGREVLRRGELSARPSKPEGVRSSERLSDESRG